ncbi:hypothetical protein [Streptomyces sp. NPDC005533]|uniref:hypothetical protein n=1 Tax=Streptomyces sp. NPDC005533 TaxID=3364723 RepID=UPI0036B2801E
MSCGIGSDGRWHGWYTVRLRADALRRMGLHPDQPMAGITHPSPPAWWHAAAEQRAHRGPSRPPGSNAVRRRATW